MKVRLTDDGAADAERVDAWWRENRQTSPTLFNEELGRVLNLIGDSAGAGMIYKTLGGREVRRTLLEKTRHYVYHYVAEDAVVVVAIWGTERGNGPPLRVG